MRYNNVFIENIMEMMSVWSYCFEEDLNDYRHKMMIIAKSETLPLYNPKETLKNVLYIHINILN